MDRRLIGFFSALLLSACDPTSKPALVIMGDSLWANMIQYQSSLPEPFKSANIVAKHGAKISTTAATPPIVQQTEAYNSGYKFAIIEGGLNNWADSADHSDTIAGYTYILSHIPMSTKVIFVGIVPTENAAQNAEVKAFLPQLNVLCGQRPNCVVATDAQSLDMTGKTIDGQHPNPDGYIALTNSLLPLLK